MKNKYYTPEISEFHEGFEFEFHLRGYKWDSMIYGFHCCTLEDEGDGNPQWHDQYGTLENFRVKHLDREDIKSLSFKENDIQTTSYVGEYYILDGATINHVNRGEVVDIHLVYQPLTNWVLIWQPMEYIINGGTSTVDNVRFSGKLANKSELKKILKQLGICG